MNRWSRSVGTVDGSQCGIHSSQLRGGGDRGGAEGANSRLRDVIAAVDCTYEVLASDVRSIAAENGELLQTN